MAPLPVQMGAPKNLFISTLLIASLLFLSECKKDVLSSDEVRNHCIAGVSPVHKVLFIGINGCRTDALLAAKAPAFDSLMAHAFVNLHCDRGPYTVSAPGWSTLLHGVFPAKHGVTSNDLSNLNYGMYHDLFYYMRQANPYFNLAEVSHWDNFLRLTTSEDYAQNVATDAEVKDKALYLLQSCAPDVLLLHFDDVDDTGHESGFSPDNSAYLNSIVQTGKYTAEIIQRIRTREQFFGEEWMVVVVTDHGGSGTSHGDQDDVEATRYVFEIVRLPGSIRTEIPIAANVDIMPTILKYMNVPVESGWALDGSPLF